MNSESKNIKSGNKSRKGGKKETKMIVPQLNFQAQAHSHKNDLRGIDITRSPHMETYIPVSKAGQRAIRTHIHVSVRLKPLKLNDPPSSQHAQRGSLWRQVGDRQLM